MDHLGRLTPWKSWEEYWQSTRRMSFAGRRKFRVIISGECSYDTIVMRERCDFES